MHDVVNAGRRRLNLWKHKALDLHQFHVTRDGDHLLSLFICCIYLFCILQNRDMDLYSPSDISLVSTLIRAVLDVFWSCARSMVSTNKGYMQRDINYLEGKGLLGACYDLGPTPFFGFYGIEAAVSVLCDSQRVGKYYAHHKQWDSSLKTK